MTDTPVPPTGAGTPADGPVSAQAPFIVKLAIVVFTTTYLLAALALLLDFWVLQQTHLKQLLGLALDRPLSPMFLSALHAMVGAVLGAGVLDFVSFHHYASKGDFEARHVWGYFVSPLLAAVLGLVVFALLQSGLLVFAGGAQDKADDVARLGYLAVGFLAGFGWYEATQSIRRIVQRFFSAGGADARPPPPPSTPPALTSPPAPLAPPAPPPTGAPDASP